jgi:hypothetical protein
MKKIEKNMLSSISVFCLILNKQVFTDMMSCLIILSKCPYLCLFLRSVQMHSGRHPVNIDFQPLGLKSDRKEGAGGILGAKKFKFKSLHFHNINIL